MRFTLKDFNKYYFSKSYHVTLFLNILDLRTKIYQENPIDAGVYKSVQLLSQNLKRLLLKYTFDKIRLTYKSFKYHIF